MRDDWENNKRDEFSFDLSKIKPIHFNRDSYTDEEWEEIKEVTIPAAYVQNPPDRDMMYRVTLATNGKEYKGLFRGTHWVIKLSRMERMTVDLDEVIQWE